MGLFGLTMCSASAKSSSRSLLSPMTMTQVESSRQWPPQSPAAGPWSQPARPGGTLSFWGAHALRHGGSPASQEATSVGLRGPVVTTVGAYPPTASCQVSPGAAAQSRLPNILHVPSPGPHGPGCSTLSQRCPAPSSRPHLWFLACLPPSPVPSPPHSPLPT